MIKLPVVIKSKRSGIFRNSIEDFRPYRIIESLCKETGLSETVASLIGESAIRKIVLSNVRYLTSPMVREIVCCELLYYGYEKERTKYTSPRISFYDFDLLVSNGHSLQEIKDYIYKEMISQFNGLKEIYNNL